MTPLPEIVIGPFFSHSLEKAEISKSVKGIGATMEFATSKGAVQIPIYRKICSYAPDCCLFEELLLHSDDLPCEVNYQPFYAAETSFGKFIPLEATLVGIYRNFSVHRTLTDVLSDLTNTVLLEFRFKCFDGCITEPLEKMGFGLSPQSSYGRSVSACACWIPPSERAKSEKGGILASLIDFRPQPNGTIGNGTWKEPWEHSISNELCKELRKLVCGSPVKLLTDHGKAKLLAMFEWTTLARMTSKQAREARIDLIRSRSDLKGDIRALAEALHSAGLYAPSTTVHQIIKSIPSLILECGLRS